MEKETIWTDKEWGEFMLPPEPREIILRKDHTRRLKNAQGEWQAPVNGLTKYLSYQRVIAHPNRTKNEECVDPGISKELMEAFTPLVDSRKPRVIRYSRMIRVASAYMRAVNQLPLEQSKLDELEEAVRWEPLSKNLPNMPEGLNSYRPSEEAINFIMKFFENGRHEEVELIVAAVSAINRDGKRFSYRLPSALEEWQKIRGLRSTGNFKKSYELNRGDDCPECSKLEVELKPNKSSASQFKKMMQRYGRKTIIQYAKDLHTDTSDISYHYQAQECKEGGIYYRSEGYKAVG